MCFFKKRGVNLKAKKIIIEGIIISMIVVLDVYLISLNINIKQYMNSKVIKSTANYIQIEEEKEETYEGKVKQEIIDEIDQSLNSTISGKGELIVNYSLEVGVDPYLATAIILHETGCSWTCSNLVRECNNVGGQKGSGCGSYSYFNSLDEGIIAFIDNLYLNYISIGLITPEDINPKYAEDPNWSINVNKYIEKIRAQ